MGRSHPAHLINVLEFELGDEAVAVCIDDLLVIFNGVLLLLLFAFDFGVFLVDDFLLGFVGVVVIVEDGNCAVKSLKLTPIMSSFNAFSSNKLLFVVE
jgi:hypothetical protein